MNKIKNKIFEYIKIILAISGYVYENTNILRIFGILFSLIIYFLLITYHPKNYQLAIIYYIIIEFFYIGFITITLRKNGIRKWFIKKYGEEKGYKNYQGILGILFFNNGLSISYVASSSSGNLFNFMNNYLILIIASILFIIGFVIKIWSTKIVSVDIYYWKDMFLRRKITKFSNEGPYKYFNNPMYGIGQLQSYALAIYYGSIYGLIIAIFNQIAIFMFYYTLEKKFIKEIYFKNKTKKFKINSKN